MCYLSFNCRSDGAVLSDCPVDLENSSYYLSWRSFWLMVSLAGLGGIATVALTLGAAVLTKLEEELNAC